MISAFLRRLLHPFPHFPFLNGHVFSQADALAERIGLAETEKAAGQAGFALAGRALSRFLDDPEAMRALKKEFHRIFEHRLRAVALRADPGSSGDKLDPGPLSHPLDHAALAALQAHDPGLAAAIQAGTKARLLQGLSVLVAAMSFLGLALAILARYGRLKVTPRRVQVAGPVFGHAIQWRMLRAAAQELGLWREDSQLFLIEDRTKARLLDGEGFECIDPQTLPVPAGPWLRRVVGPGLLLIARAFAAAIIGWRDPRSVEAAARAINLGGRTMLLWRLAFNIRCRWYLDVEDNSSLHNLRGIIQRKFGGGVARWPYTQNETPGVFCSLMGYDLYLSGGPVQWRTHRASWMPGLRNIPIGQLRNDRRMIADVNVEPDYRRRIEERLARGERMAVYFGGNLDPGFLKPMMDSFAAMLPILADRPGWFLVVKPKFLDGFYDLCRQDGRFQRLAGAGNIITIHYPKAGQEVCPSGWLIDRMTLGLTLPGSVQFEALTGGRVMMAYWPYIQHSESRRILRESDLLFDDAGKLAAAMAAFVDDPEGFRYPLDWLRDNFDPFDDDRALERLASAIFSDNAVAP